MEKAPTVEMITAWLQKRRPLDIGDPISVKDIDPKPWSGHFNFLVTAPEKRFTLRFKGPEWGEPTQGVRNEYETLKTLEPYAVGSKVFGLEQDFFGEPAIFMEYLEGRSLNAVSSGEEKQKYSEAVGLILKINRIPYQNLNLPLAEPYVSYERSKRVWHERLGVIEQWPQLNNWAVRLRELLPRAEAMLDGFEPRLKRVLDGQGPAFLFLSAHIGHCFVTPAGLRFINWEEVTYGDPSFTLAVFLTSIISRPDLATIKEAMIQQYLNSHPIPEFRELVDQRLCEREVSNLFWVLWAYANRQDTSPLDKATGAPTRYDRVGKILEQYSL